MRPPKMMVTEHAGPVFGTEALTSEMQQWNATLPQLRDVVLRRRIGACNMDVEAVGELGVRYHTTQAEVESISSATYDAFNAGRVFDFGFWPNEVIQQASGRGGRLYRQKGVGHPFLEPWCFYHTWEIGAALYVVNPDAKHPVGGPLEIAELQPMKLANREHLVIGDRALIQMMTDDQYWCEPAPSAWSFLAGMRDAGFDPMVRAGANVVDPLMTALLILNTRNVERETVTASEKLNRARVKSGKLPIPPYDRINSGPYVTALLGHKGPRGEGQGGTHASPITHIRRGHMRTYQSGQRTFIKDTLVNATDEARTEFQRARTHYEVKR